MGLLFPMDLCFFFTVLDFMLMTYRPGVDFLYLAVPAKRRHKLVIGSIHNAAHEM